MRIRFTTTPDLKTKASSRSTMQLEGAVAETYARVRQWLQEMYGEQCEPDADLPRFRTPSGSALVETVIRSWGNDTMIGNWACVVSGASLEPALLKYLLELNVRVSFGAFGIDREGNIMFGHNILGSECDKPELKASVQCVAEIADRYDNKIIEIWGGSTALHRE